MTDTLRDRLIYARSRSGLTQKALAKASGVSLSLIRGLEQGQVPGTRNETLHKLAQAMRVTTSTLSGGGGDPETAHTETVQVWEPVRRALVGKVEPQGRVTVESVASKLAAAQRVFRTGQFNDLAPGLPALIRSAASLGEEGRAVRCDVYSLTGWLLTHTHQYDTAHVALRLARDDAHDRPSLASVEHVNSWLLIRQGQLDECHQRSVAWADQLEMRFSKATANELGAWGWALLRVAMTAVRDNQPGGARDALRLAGAAASAIGKEIHADGDWRRPFGPGVVAAKTAELAMIEDRPDKVLALAATIPASVSAVNTANWNRHRLDLACANARLGRTDAALGIFEHLRATALPWLAEQRYGRDILGQMVAARKHAMTPQMRSLADAIRMPY